MQSRAWMRHLLVEKHVGCVRSGYGQGSAADRFVGGGQLDFYVVAKAIETLHQFAFREVGEIAVHEAGDLGLGDAHAACGVRLRQSQTAHGTSDFNHQAGFDFEQLGVGQAEVGEDIAGTGFDIDGFSGLFCHAVSPLPAPRLLSAWSE
jgi:hypothetical protein